MAKNVNCKNLVDVYMPISRDDAKRMRYKSSDICVRRIGVKNVTCIKTQGTPEFKKWWETTLDSEARAELREKRCLVSDGVRVRRKGTEIVKRKGTDLRIVK